MRYGYARVSTDEQSLARQQSALALAGCDQVVEEVESGVKARRRLNALLERLQAGDELIVAELDRLGRSTGEALLLMDELIKRDVQLRILALPSLDIATNDGRLIADILASLAAHERRRLRERQRQGIAAARSAGRHLGRPQKMNGQQVGEAQARLAADEPVPVVARAYGVTPKTLRATLARVGVRASMPARRSV
ncbi:recombinase family protein [Sphingomonas sp. CFBP 13728]|uniref:recombinase family protein n=1 Tax=Sphingomonas sp. CFBP 13728 TaxID=2775294 RepID=UPI0017814CE3|nr:recombinase family protein [Sphingomonas sp. CFBP 13728]MBD8621190.1 recombinase family protein [Sphingomonas sp. CFBP 13728]